MEKKDIILGAVNLNDLLADKFNLTVEIATSSTGEPITGTTKKGVEKQLYQFTLPKETNMLGMELDHPIINFEDDTHQMNPWCQFWGPVGLEGVPVGLNPEKIQIAFIKHFYEDADTGAEKSRINQVFKDLKGGIIKPIKEESTSKEGMMQMETKKQAEPEF